MTRARAESGQAGRTLVCSFSDNGGPVKSGADNTPLRGTKGQLHEGGIRVPFLVAWPDRPPAGRTYDEPVSSLDVFATALADAGLAAAIDGWSEELVEPVFPGSSAKSEDWGPGGANQRGRPGARRPRPKAANPG